MENQDLTSQVPQSSESNLNAEKKKNKFLTFLQDHWLYFMILSTSIAGSYKFGYDHGNIKPDEEKQNLEKDTAALQEIIRNLNKRIFILTQDSVKFVNLKDALSLHEQGYQQGDSSKKSIQSPKLNTKKGSLQKSRGEKSTSDTTGRDSLKKEISDNICRLNDAYSYIEDLRRTNQITKEQYKEETKILIEHLSKANSLLKGLTNTNDSLTLENLKRESSMHLKKSNDAINTIKGKYKEESKKTEKENQENINITVEKEVAERLIEWESKTNEEKIKSLIQEANQKESEAQNLPDGFLIRNKEKYHLLKSTIEYLKKANDIGANTGKQINLLLKKYPKFLKE